MKMWHIYTMEYCLAVKKSETIKCAVKRLELGKVVLSEITQTQADESHRTSSVHGSYSESSEEGINLEELENTGVSPAVAVHYVAQHMPAG